MDYKLKYYSSLDDFSKEEYMPMNSFHWESAVPYRPVCLCKVGIAGDELAARLKVYESAPRTVFSHRDEPVYRDSCLEFFVGCVDGRDEYINIECNSRGVFLCGFGNGKHNRRLAADITGLSPRVSSFEGKDDKGDYWGVQIALSKAFVRDVYKLESDFVFSDIRTNFYKCGDDCEIPHYVAFSPVTTLPPGFHNPECFAKFIRSF